MYLTLLFNPEQGIPCSGKRTFRLVSLKHTIEKTLLRSKERQDARDQNHTLHGRDQSVRIPGMAYPECMSPPNTSIDLCIISTDSHQNSPVFANTKIILVPTFQGGIMQMNDNRPPFTVKSTSSRPTVIASTEYTDHSPRDAQQTKAPTHLSSASTSPNASKSLSRLQAKCPNPSPKTPSQQCARCVPCNWSDLKR